jgi:hypothetical protein
MNLLTNFSVVTLLSLLGVASSGARAEEPRDKGQQIAQAQTPQDHTAKTYFPGLGEFMARIQVNHAKLWLAGEAHNWGLADYQLGEMKEVFSDLQDFMPRYQNIPVSDMIEAIITGAIRDLEGTIATRDFGKFSASFDRLTESCNSCHAAANRAYIAIQRPTQSNFSNQNFTTPK